MAAAEVIAPAVPPAAAASRGFGWSKLQMLVATVARMGTGLVTFVLLARFLGPAPFGKIAAAIAYSTLFGIVSDFGLASFSLRTASARPADAARIVREALDTKLVLAIALGVVGAIALAAIGRTGDMLVYGTVFVGTMAASRADIALIAVRARNRFDVEAKLVIAASVFWLLAVGLTAALTRDLTACAIAYGASRFAYHIVGLAVLRPWLRTERPHRRFAGLRQTLRGASTYAADSMLTSLSSQIDVLIFGAMLPLAAFGIYQAGARLIGAILPFAVVLSTVYLPRMASAVADGRDGDFRHLGRRVTLEFAGMAVIAAAGFAIAGPLVTRILYGPAYAALVPLWYGFALFAMLRIVAAGFGVQLVALGEIPLRIGSQVLAMIVFAAIVFVALPRTGLSATSWMLAASGVPLVLVLGIGVARGRGDVWPVAATMALTAAVGAMLVAAAMLVPTA